MFLKKVAESKGTPTQVLSCEICEIFKEHLFKEHLRTTAFDKRTKYGPSFAS